MSEIRPVDPHDDAALRDWYAVTHAGAAAGRRHPLVFGFDELAASVRNASANVSRELFGVYEADRLTGALKLDFPRRENTDSAEWTLNVAPPDRGRGYATALFEHGMAVAAANGRRKHLAEVDVPHGCAPAEHPGSRFALKHGFVSRHTEQRMVLELPVDTALLAELNRRAAERHAGYGFVSWSGYCPAEHLDAYVDMRNSMERDVPTGELDHEIRVWDARRLRDSEKRMEQQGYTTLVTAARAAAGEFAGYTLIFVPPGDGPEVYQDDTLVVTDHRGHRLGAALKARNLTILAERFGDRSRVHTWTDPDNAPMRRVNRAFGFDDVETMHEFQRVDAA